MIRPLALALFATLAPLAGAQDVWVVDATGAGDFVDLQAAADFAGQGDTLLVKPGDYGGLTLVNKSLRVYGDGSSQPTLNGPVAIRALALQREVAVADLEFRH